MRNQYTSATKITPEHQELADLVGKAVWEMWKPVIRENVIRLLQGNHSPKEIESHMKTIISRNHPHMKEWQVKEQAGRYYMAADYAKRNNLHLN